MGKMKVPTALSFISFILVFLSVYNGLTEAAGRSPRVKRNVFQLADIVHTYTGSPLKFLRYGCYCGMGGQAKPLDELDRCCENHDLCYKRRRQNCNISWWMRFLSGIWVTYNYNCGDSECFCNDTGYRSCKRYICECDRALGKCLRQHLNTYNEAYYGVRDTSLCS